MTNIMKTIATWLWCFPQQLAGFILCKITKAKKVGDHYEYNIQSGSISLGEYIFLCPAHKDDATVLKHEQGHMKQSRMLGWLYLLVIGIPSIVWARCFEWYRSAHGISYYDFYTEKWADELGGVQR